MKKCTQCEEIKTYEEFGKRTKNKDGYRECCKKCHYIKQRAYDILNKEKKYAATQKWRDNNQEEVLEYSRTYYLNNTEQVKQKSVDYRINNPEKIANYSKWYVENNVEVLRERRKKRYAEKQPEMLAYGVQYRFENRDKINAYAKAYAIKNRPALTARQVFREAYKRQATPQWANLDSIKKFYEEAARMTKKTGIEYTVDHIVPLKGQRYGVSGLHCEFNLQILTRSENARKGNRFNSDWLQVA